MYKYKKERYKIMDRIRNHESRFYNSLINMFTYKGPKELPFEFFYNLEKYLIKEGEAAIIMPSEDLSSWYIAHADRIPDKELDDYGEGTGLLVTTDNGESETFLHFRNNKNVVYCRNNYTSEADAEAERYAAFLADIDKSILHNVLNCRVSPLINVTSKTQKKEIDVAIENSDNGKVRTVSGFVDPLNGGNNIPTVINFNDVQNIDKVQYLTTLRENVERWFFSMYGLSTSGSTKMAQQSVDEVNAAENIARILPDVKLEMRQMFLAELKEKTGIEITVAFNDAWKKERSELTTPDSTGQMETELTIQEGEANGADDGSTDPDSSMDPVGNEAISEEVADQIKAAKDKLEDVENLLGVSAEAAEEYEKEVEV